jgi:hypothetical protein
MTRMITLIIKYGVLNNIYFIYNKAILPYVKKFYSIYNMRLNCKDA